MNNNKIFAKNLLQQYCQRKKIGEPPHYLPKYESKAKGNLHERQYQATVYVGDQKFTTEDQWFSKKKNAEIEAAWLALEKLQIPIDEVDDKTKRMNKIIEKIETWIKSIPLVISILGLSESYGKLKLKDQITFRQNLTFAFLHGSVLNIQKCKKLLKECLELSDSSDVQDYNALECLGDAVIELITTKHLLMDRNITTAGEITKTRAKFVNRQRLNRLLEQAGLDQYVMYAGNTEVKTTSVHGDVLEAVIGAVYSTFGIEKAEDVARKVFDVCDERSEFN
jgi:dsRNA-specific ribonuclease